MTEQQSENVQWHAATISHDEREERAGQRGCILWLTGLSGSGKSTIGRRIEERLVRDGVWAYVLDGDNLRMGLNGDLAFSAEDRTENIRRVGHVAKLFADSACICISSFISPFRADRDRVRALVPPGRFIEIHVATPLEVCEARDPKGLYARARAGLIGNFTGISSPYEEPVAAELTLETTANTVDECASLVIEYLREAGLLPSQA